MEKYRDQKIIKLAYSLDESANMLGVSKGHIRNEHVRGKLQLIKSGRRTLILAEELKRYLKELSEKEYQP